MFGKFLLIALVCVSFAQVHGAELENAISNALKRMQTMNEDGKIRYDEAVQDADSKLQLLDSRTCELIEKSTSVQQSSRQTLRNIAALTERKARENNRPEAVFQCITRYEDGANRDISHYIRTFEVDIQRLRAVKQDNFDTATTTYDDMEHDLEQTYQMAVFDIERCQNVGCVNTVVRNFSTYMNSMYATIKRVEGQISTILTNFQRDANNYFTNSNRQITMIRSAAVRNIKNCYFRGEVDPTPAGCQDSEESLEV